MAVVTKRLAVGNSSPVAVDKTIYTCPANETCIVKDVRLSTTGAAVGLAVLRAVSGPTTVWLVGRALAAVETAQLEPWVVLHPGDSLVVFASTGSFTFWISGSELEGVAS